ncbi:MULTISPECIES: acyl carrier protein [Streptomyces]|uniref:Acyl carrier protein n=1 Tax=Streptomyces microflavus TaxID=1919 RepID=A0ABV1QD98_STRMI|nr:MULTISPECIES: acyl carrier protein [Streptomyces]MEE1730088.1 phosphopantetheine-binding protein [Streptomyces sp. BE282]WSR91148.1 phosphopantetheine-binding protein [Streptomyces microflavus]
MTTESGIEPEELIRISEDQIARFVVERFLPDVEWTELDPDYDLLTTGVIDSLGVLQIASWLAKQHGITLTGPELTAGNFRSVRTIRATAERPQAGGAA